MNKLHTFKTSLTWEKNLAEATDTKKTSSKSHIVHIVGKPVLAVSAAKTFKGDPTMYNPEDLLLSSLASCHMMSYLYVCAQHQIEVLSYTDNAEAILETHPNGSGKIIEVFLSPVVIVADKSQIEKATVLHSEANKLCFIANSCNFPIKYVAKCKIDDL